MQKYATKSYRIGSIILLQNTCDIPFFCDFACANQMYVNEGYHLYYLISLIYMHILHNMYYLSNIYTYTYSTIRISLLTYKNIAASYVTLQIKLIGKKRDITF